MDSILLLAAVLTVFYMVTINLIGLKLLAQIVEFQHKKTRKESQEIKTRLTQVRKDLNKIEAQTTIKPIKKMAKIK